MPSIRRAVVARDADELKALKVLRTYLAERLEASESDRDRAALAGRFLDTVKRITDLEARTPAATSALDEITARRAARRRPIRDGVKREEA